MPNETAYLRPVKIDTFDQLYELFFDQRRWWHWELYLKNEYRHSDYPGDYFYSKYLVSQFHGDWESSEKINAWNELFKAVIATKKYTKGLTLFFSCDASFDQYSVYHINIYKINIYKTDEEE